MSEQMIGAGGSCSNGMTSLLLCAAMLWNPCMASAQDAAAQPDESHRATIAPDLERAEFTVSNFVVEYDRGAAGLPLIDELLAEARPSIFRSADGILATTAESGAISIADLNASGASRYSRAALEAITRSIVEALSDRGLIGVLVAINPDDLAIEVEDPAAPLASGANRWTDQRGPGIEALGITIYTARVVEVRTVAAGKRFPIDQRVNNPAHARIARLSPLTASGDTLRRDLLDAYAFRLNRHPARRVDVAVSPATEPGDVVLDYLVREDKPWIAFAQIANTGTEQTEEIRERFGFIHNQLTNNDDQLIIDYITAGFSEAHAVLGSYEFPIGERLRLRTLANYSQYDASQVGLGDAGFMGESWSAGAELSYNIFQYRELFVDLTGGMRWETISVDNETIAVTGRDSFLLPNFGARLERFTDEATTAVYLRFETNLSGIAATGGAELENLGRTDPDADWWTIQWGIEQSFYLEPLLDARRFRNGRSTLAHELLLRVRGQEALDARLVPNYQDVAGGAESVRGYPESVVAGDDAVVATVEYRLHIPRLYRPYDETGGTPPTIFGEPFRWRPQTRYARPDWDLIWKAFLDVGRTENDDPFDFETDETLIGAGWGIELLIGRNFNFKADFGVALEEVEQPTRVTVGSSRLHFAFTLLF